MKIEYLVGGRNKQQDLDAFARALFLSAGVSQFEQRESSSYIDETYYRGRIGKISVCISWADPADLAELPFWVLINGEVQDGGAFKALVDEMVLGKLCPAGFRFMRIKDFGLLEQSYLPY